MPTINELNAVTGPAPGDLVAVYSQTNGDARKLSLYNLGVFLAEQNGNGDAMVTQYAAPTTTGFSVPLRDTGDDVWLVLTPTGTLAAGTLTLPTKAGSIDRQELLVSTSNAVTALTVNGNGSSVVGAPTTLAAGGFFRLRFEAVTSTWYRVG